jgi:hypothetical protein
MGASGRSAIVRNRVVTGNRGPVKNIREALCIFGPADRDLAEEGGCRSCSPSGDKTSQESRTRHE